MASVDEWQQRRNFINENFEKIKRRKEVCRHCQILIAMSMGFVNKCNIHKDDKIHNEEQGAASGN